MKLVGFLKEYNDMSHALDLDFVINFQSSNDSKKILEYLDNGDYLLGWVGSFQDVNTLEYFAPDGYLTDGTWIWPTYFPYYLKKYPNMYIDNDFISYLKDKDYIFKLDYTSMNKENLEREFSSILKYPKRNKV